MSLHQTPAWLRGSSNLLRRQAHKQETVAHAVGGWAQHEDLPGPVLAPREDLQAMKHESQVGGCSESRGAKVERWERSPWVEGGSTLCLGESRSGCRGGSACSSQGGFHRVLTSLGTLESPWRILSQDSLPRVSYNSIHHTLWASGMVTWSFRKIAVTQRIIPKHLGSVGKRQK